MSVSSLRVVSSAFAQIAWRKSLTAGSLLSGLRSVQTSFGRSPLSRSIWYLTNSTSTTNCAGWRNKNVCKLHTSGDSELAEFLKDEIKVEKDIEKKSGKLPKIKNFEITKTDGPNVILTRKLDHETITVKFNVNNSVEDPEMAMEGEHQSDSEPSQLLSRPPFVVEINKGGDKTLAIHCVFPHPDDLPSPTEQDQAEQYEDLIEIQDVALLNKSQEWTDDVYSLSSSVMDGNLYDMLLKFLEERGVNGDFLQEVIDFSTSFEHKRYIELLEQLKEFADSK